MSDRQHSNRAGIVSKLQLKIMPEPTEDEREALIAALAIYLSMRSTDATTTVAPATASKWAKVGRREAVRGLANSPAMGWGRKRVL